VIKDMGYQKRKAATAGSEQLFAVLLAAAVAGWI